jgi:type IV pilus assembly protein PilV
MTRRSVQGFTLLEIMITVVIVTVGIVAVVRSLSTGLRGDFAVEGKTTALNFAQQKMETLFNAEYEDVTTSPVDCTGSYLGWAQPDSTNFPDYYWCWTVTDNTNYKTVTVKVDWAYRGQTLEASLITYVANLLPYS